MNEVYINVKGLEIDKYFTTDLVSIDQLVTCIVDLEVEIDILKEKIQEMKEPYEDDPYDKWRDSQRT